MSHNERNSRFVSPVEAKNIFLFSSYKIRLQITRLLTSFSSTMDVWSDTVFLLATSVMIS